MSNKKARHVLETLVTNPLTGDTTKVEVEVESESESVPESVTLAHPFAFYDDDGKLHSWPAGFVSVDATEIGVLIERGAIFTAETAPAPAAE